MIDCVQGLGETLSDDYGAAVVHVAWERKKSHRTLLLAWVELLPSEIARPHDEGETWLRIQSNRDNHLHVRHAVTTAERGVRWYRDCARGIAVRPENDGSLPDPALDVVTLAMSPIDDEPRWPNLICTNSPILPFLNNWYACPRVHHLLAPAFAIGSLWNEGQRAVAEQWLSTQLHFDLAEHAFLWGSVHLVAPNPVFRDLDQQLESSENSTQERILLHVQARAGHSVAGLHLRFLEQRPTGLSISKQSTLTGPSISLQFNHILSETAVEIHDPRRGLLWFEPPTHFLKSVGLQMSIASGQRVISDEHGPLVKVPLVTDFPPTSVGTPAPIPKTSAVMQLVEASTRHQASVERRPLERWFSGQHDEAIAMVHALIQNAFHRVVIVDPYFGRSELRFAVVSRVRVPVFVLTSNDGLVDREKKGEPQEAFVTSVDRFVATPNINPLEVRVMPGAGIHDRFLVIDDRVFLLGSSLNRFGDRGTMIVQLHAPEVVREELLRELKDGKALHQWLAERRTAQIGEVVQALFDAVLPGPKASWTPTTNSRHSSAR